MEKHFFNGTKIVKIGDDRFYIIGAKNKGLIKNFIAKKFNIKNFKCVWIEREEVKVSGKWKYEALRIN